MNAQCEQSSAKVAARNFNQKARLSSALSAKSQKSLSPFVRVGSALALFVARSSNSLPLNVITTTGLVRPIAASRLSIAPLRNLNVMLKRFVLSAAKLYVVIILGKRLVRPNAAENSAAVRLEQRRLSVSFPLVFGAASLLSP